MRVDLCGVRGSTPTPGAEFLRYGGHTSCVALTLAGEDAPSLILDAGTGIRTVSRLLADRPFRGTLLLSHLHWDHIQGLPFFHPANCEEASIKLLLPEQDNGAEALSVLARAMSPPFFPMEPDQMRGSWSFGTVEPGEWQDGALSVMAREIPHKGGRTFGYRISDGARSLAYMPDHHPTAFGPGPDGLGEYHTAALELADGVDLLLHDAQLLLEELEAQGAYGHAAADYAVALGARAGAREVVLFHHHPDRTDEALDALGARLSAERGVTLAVQGATLQL